MDNELRARLDAYLAENFVEEDFLAEEPVAEKISTPKDSSAKKVSKKKSSATRALVKRNEPPHIKCFCVLPSIAYSLAKVDFNKMFAESDEETFSEMMIRLVAESGEKNSAIYNRARISHQFFYRIKRNREYQPSKDTAVVLALALKLNLDKAKKFLAAAGYTLSKSKRDLIITFFIENGIYDVDELNDYLHEYNQTLLHGR